MNDSGISLSPSTPAQDNSGQKQTDKSLTVDAVEFLCYALYKIWYSPHKAHPNSTESSMPLLPIDPISTVIKESYVIAPSGTHEWFPKLVTQVEHLVKNASLSTTVTFVALLYISRLRSITISSPTEEKNGRRLYQLFMCAIIVAQKQFSDYPQSVKYWSKIVGYDLNDIGFLERLFLYDIRWNLAVNQADYKKWKTILANLGREHVIIAKAVAIDESKLDGIRKTLHKRDDLYQEILEIRRRIN
jgi:hypothetical protein